MVRTNKNGETLWTRFNVGHEPHYWSSDINDLITIGDKIYLLGIADIRLPTGATVYRTFLVVINAAGEVINKTEYIAEDWQRGVNLIGQCFALLPDSCALIAGQRWVMSYVSDSSFIFLLKINPSRQEIWRFGRMRTPSPLPLAFMTQLITNQEAL